MIALVFDQFVSHSVFAVYVHMEKTEREKVGVRGGLIEGPSKPKVGFGKRERNDRCGGSGRRANTKVGVKTLAHLVSMRGTPTATQW